MFRFNNKFELCVIPPLRDKKYEEEPWKSLFEAAKEVINNTDKMIIYGFGFSENDEAL